MKKTIIILSALIAVTGFNACQRELQVPEKARTLEIPVVLEGETKVDANVNTGACSWTTGDQVAVWVNGGAANHYVAATVTSGKISVSLAEGQSLANYAVYPDGFQDNSNFGGDNPGVIYPATYDFTDHAALGTYTMAPMMAKYTEDELKFYNVGCMLRLTLTNVPASTEKIQVVFNGVDNVCGTCTVSKPGTVNATTTVTTGGGNTITATGFTYNASINVNLPIPTGDYSGLTTLHVKVLDSSDAVLKQVAVYVDGTWGTLKHGYARIIPVDFTNDVLSLVSLSSNTAATLWKGETEQRIAKAKYADGSLFKDCTITWESSAPSVASVNPTTGLVTALSAGTTTITATATASLGGTEVSDSYTVYVNSVSGISVTGPSIIAPGGSASVYATITHTNTTGGAITHWPVITWSSGTPAAIALTASTSNPAYATATTATAIITAEGKTLNTSSVVTATIAGDYTDTGLALSANKTIACDYPISISTSGGVIKFRGYEMGPGFLQFTSGSYSLTGELDGIASLMAAYGTEAGQAKHYFDWNTLTELPNGITGNIVGDWRIPTAAEWDTILNTAPTSTALNSTPLSNGFVKIVVNLTGSPLAGQGLTTNSITSAGSGIKNGGTVNRTNYIAGLLLIPDRTTITCQKINSSTVGSYTTSWSTTSNCITYFDFETLVTGGCVFLPAVGNLSNTFWTNGGTYVLFYSATQYDTSNATVLMFLNENGSSSTSLLKSNYLPVRLIR